MSGSNGWPASMRSKRWRRAASSPATSCPGPATKMCAGCSTAPARTSATSPRLRDDRVVPVRLDVTDRGSIEAAAAIATDVTLLVNNAGIMTGARVLGDEDQLRSEIEVNYLGTVAVTRAFAPILAANGGGAVI